MSPISGPGGSGKPPIDTVSGLVDIGKGAKDATGSSEAGGEGAQGAEGAGGPAAGANMGMKFVSAGMGSMQGTKGNLEAAASESSQDMAQVNKDIASDSSTNKPDEGGTSQANAAVDANKNLLA